MNDFHRFAFLFPLVTAALGCAAPSTESSESSSQASTKAQDIAFECRCEDDACRVPGLMDLRVYHATNEDTIRVQTFFGTSMLSTSQTSNFVAKRAEETKDAIVFDGFEHVSPSLEPKEPSRPEDEMLLGATMRIDRELLATGPEYDGEEIPPSIHRSFGFVDVERNGELFSYTCVGLWREDI